MIIIDFRHARTVIVKNAQHFPSSVAIQTLPRESSDVNPPRVRIRPARRSANSCIFEKSQKIGVAMSFGGI